MKIIAQKFSEKDILDRVAWINHNSINNLMHFELPATVDNTMDWYRDVYKDSKRIDLIFKDDQSVSLGMAGLTGINLKDQNAEFYIFINPEKQGIGLGTILTEWTVNFAFLKHNLNKVFLYTDSDNTKAISLYEKLGFIKEGAQRNHRYKNGLFKDKISFGMLREEWLSVMWSQKVINLSFEFKA